jgi:hypothetical protein
MAEDTQASLSLPTFAQMGGVPYSPPAEDAAPKDATPKDANSDNILRNFMNQSLADPLASMYKQKAQAEADVESAKLRQKQTELAGKARAASGYAAGMHQKYNAAEPELMAPPPKFNVTKDTQEGLVGLAALMTVGGLIIGSKGMTSGVNAMNAMTGVMKGYQEGNKERIEFETKKYEKEMDNWKTHLQQVKDSLSRYEKLASVDLNAATAKAASDAAAQGQTVIAAQLKANGISYTLNMVEKLENKFQTGRLHPVIDNETNKPTFATEAQIRENPDRYQQAYKPTASGGAGAVQFRYNAAVTNAANQASLIIDNVASLPLSSAPPAASNVLTDPSKGLTDAAIKYFAQTTTSAEDRANQQTYADLNRAIANIAAAGRPGGVTQSAIGEFAKMAPQPGDKKINTYLYLATVKQEFEIAYKDLLANGGTPEQIAQAKAAKERVEGIIPFSVKDVNRIIRSGGEQLISSRTAGLLQTSNALSEFENGLEGSAGAPSFESAEDVKSAVQSGRISREDGLKMLKERFGYN